MNSYTRRYDIDWLRVIAIFLLLLYHIGIGFQPWGVFIGFIQNNQSINSLWVPMSMLNIWRIPLLFFVSGMGLSFAMRKRTVKGLIAERARRILVPFIFGIVAIVPIHLLIWQAYYRQDLSYSINQGHLWFLGNIFSYVIIISPLLVYLQRNQDCKLVSILRKLYSSPVGLMIVTVIFMAEAILLQPETFEAYSLTLHGYLVGFLSFIFGFSFIYSGEVFWQTINKWKLMYLVAALLLFIIRYVVFNLEAPGYYKALESNMWIFTAFGYSYCYLNRASGLLSYLTKAVYPVYILHMIFIYLASSLLMPYDLNSAYKLLLVILITFAGSFGTYEFIIKRFKPLSILFGLK